MYPPYLVVMQNPLCKGLIQHLPVPLLQPLRLWDLLVRRMAVEDVVVSFTGWTCPDVALGIPAGIQSKHKTKKTVRELGHLLL